MIWKLDLQSEHCVIIPNLYTTGKIYTDQSDLFSHLSLAGNNYIMILHNYDSNTITSKLFRPRSKVDLLHVYTKFYKDLRDNSLHPIIRILDNKL